jgi:hypothetical protein
MTRSKEAAGVIVLVEGCDDPALAARRAQVDSFWLESLDDVAEQGARAAGVASIFAPCSSVTVKWIMNFIVASSG